MRSHLILVEENKNLFWEVQWLLLFLLFFSICRIRGSLGSILLLSQAIGMLFSYICGSFIEIEYLSWIYIWFPACFLLFSQALYETPFHLIKRGKIKVTFSVLVLQLLCHGKVRSEDVKSIKIFFHVHAGSIFTLYKFVN